VRLAEDEPDLLLGLGDVLGRVGAREDLRNPGPAGEPGLDGGVGSEDHVVLIDAFGRLSLPVEDAHDLERDAPDLDRLAHGVLAGKEVKGDGFPEDCGLPHRSKVNRAEERP